MNSRAEIENPSYWRQLREEVFISLRGAGLCGVWCHNAKGFLESNGEMGFARRNALLDDVKVYVEHGERAKANFHAWLERETDGGIFIADGTAGQFEKAYPTGYYGLLKHAPRRLRSIYNRPPLTFLDLF